MSTITIDLPEPIASELEANRVSARHLNAFLVGAVEAWLRWRKTAPESVSRNWQGAFEKNAEPFVDQLIEDNRELFEELAKK